MSRKTAIIALFAALILLAVVLYLGGQQTAREAATFRLTLEYRQIEVILSLTPHA